MVAGNKSPANSPNVTKTTKPSKTTKPPPTPPTRQSSWHSNLPNKLTKKKLELRCLLELKQNEQIKKQKTLDEQNKEDEKHRVSENFCFDVLNLEYDATGTITKTPIAGIGYPTKSMMWKML
jgi:hypothetical protein